MTNALVSVLNNINHSKISTNNERNVSVPRLKIDPKGKRLSPLNYVMVNNRFIIEADVVLYDFDGLHDKYETMCNNTACVLIRDLIRIITKVEEKNLTVCVTIHSN